MLKNVAAVLIAVTMFTAPVLAQSVAPVSPAPAPQTIKAKSPVKHVKINKHAVKKVRVGRHHMHVKHVRHGWPLRVRLHIGLHCRAVDSASHWPGLDSVSLAQRISGLRRPR